MNIQESSSKVGIMYVYVGFIISALFIFWGISVGANMLFVAVLLIWIYMMMYSYKAIEKRSLLFAFGIAFFVFLIGREFLEQYHLYDKDWVFDIDVDNHLYYCLILSLIGVWGAFVSFSKSTSCKHLYTNNRYSTIARRISRQFFFIVLPFAMIYWLAIAYIVAKTGYLSYYSDVTEMMDGNPVFNILNKISVMLNVSFCCFISTLPSKKEFKKVLIPYLAYLFITAFSGQRGPFILGLLLIFVFVVYMQRLFPSDSWFKRKYFKMCLLLVPFLASAGSLYNAWRLDRDTKDIGYGETFFNFFYEQGVTSYVVKRAYVHEDKIPDDIYILQFTHTGLLARLLGIEVYAGNTVDHATKGGSFAHALGYVVLGDQYLMGAGTGSSFIAELHYDFGYVGVFLGSALYGYLFTLIFRSQSLMQRGTVFVCITQLLWSCRASYTGFLTLLFTPTSIIVCLFTFLLPKKIWKIGHKKYFE